MEMLGLWPEPKKTPLNAKITGSFTHQGVIIDNLHFQSIPGLYVTANYYHPAKGKVDGLRIDHPDGLYDPSKYFQDLQCGMPCAGSEKAENAGRTYLVVEKILTGSERLRKDWPVDGTTGYEFSNLVNGVFIDQSAATRMERIYRSFTGESLKFDDLVYSSKNLILKVALASELNVLATALSRIALSNRHTCDFTVNSLRSALGEVISSFPVYRTYVSAAGVSVEDRRYIEQT